MEKLQYEKPELFVIELNEEIILASGSFCDDDDWCDDDWCDADECNDDCFGYEAACPTDGDCPDDM